MLSKPSLNINFLEDSWARPKILSKKSLLIIGLAATVFFSASIFFPTIDLPVQGSYAKESSPARLARLDPAVPVKAASDVKMAAATWPTKQANNQIQPKLIASQPADAALIVPFLKKIDFSAKQAGKPIRLNIPKIKLDAAIKSAGLAFNGAMGVARNPRDAAWFEYGPRPGEKGSSVITGHFGRWKNGQGSVFDNLNKLEPGDILYVEDEKGASTTFAVRELRKYSPQDSPAEVFNSNDGQAHLNLITCDGVWNKITKSYPRRLVVFADKESP